MTYQPPPPPSTFTQNQLPQRGASIRRMPSAKEVVTSSFVSPLTRLEAQGRSARSRANSASASNSSASKSFPNPNINSNGNPPYVPQPQIQETQPTPPVPTLEFGNLFRNSRYSVDSLSSVGSRLSTDSFASYGTISQNDGDGEDDGYESPSTPKASTSKQGQQSYFEIQQQRQQQSRTPSPSRYKKGSMGDREEGGGLQMKEFNRNRIPSSNSNSTINVPSSTNGALTPKRSFSVTSRRIPSNPNSKKPLPPNPPMTSTCLPQNQPSSFNLGPIPPQKGTRNRSGSNTFTKEVPVVHHQAEETEVNVDWASVHGEQGSDWGDDESQFEWVDTENAPEAINGIEGQKIPPSMSPSKRLSRLKAVVSGGGDSNQKKLKKPLIIHRRAPPPPSNTIPAPAPRSEPNSPIKKFSGIQNNNISYPTVMMPIPRSLHQDPPKRAGTLKSSSANSSTQTLRNRTESENQSQYKYTPNNSNSDILQPPQAPFSQNGIPKRPSPLMVPMKISDGPSSPISGEDSVSRQSHMSFQSIAYSYYDVDGDHSPVSTPKPIDSNSNGQGELVFPHGKYIKVSASTLERQKQSERERERKRTISKSTTGSGGDGGKSPEDFVNLGIEFRGKGDLQKSAWYFMKAAEGGSSIGRMYWGLALRHGWGIVRDDRKAFIELRQACDETLAEGGLDFHKSPGHGKLTQQQKKLMQKELSLGMFEVGNCFLDGIGVKKSPEVALAYLRFAAGMGDVASQEQLGFLLSKGSKGIKKDMKEAARWYRMAIANGSSNTFGLAWIWKDKYMT